MLAQVGPIRHDNPVPPNPAGLTKTSWPKTRRKGLQDFMNEAGAEAQHGAQRADGKTPGPIYNPKAAPVVRHRSN